MYKVVALWPHCTKQLSYLLPSSPIAFHCSIAMTVFLCKYKVVLLEHMKAIPDAPSADNEDYAIWCRQFIDIAVSQ
jgi:hypothetical protein